MGYQHEIATVEFPVGNDQLMVLYQVEDTGYSLEAANLVGRIASDAHARAADGWRILSTDTIPLRETGTTGNMLFDTGGGFTTQVAFVVVYERR